MFDTGRVEPEEKWDAIVWIEVRTVEGNAAGGPASGVDVYRCHILVVRLWNLMRRQRRTLSM